MSMLEISISFPNESEEVSEAVIPNAHLYISISTRVIWNGGEVEETSNHPHTRE